jgi:hypothetical protein
MSAPPLAATFRIVALVAALLSGSYAEAEPQRLSKGDFALLEGRRPLRFVSSSQCKSMLPCNVTDGNRLALRARTSEAPRFLEGGDFGNDIAPVR